MSRRRAVTHLASSADARDGRLLPNVALPVPVPVPQSAPGAGTVFENCDDVRAHGAAPIHRGDPGWQQELDPDGDGVGCEP
jgi:hypothetical protein